MTQAPGRAASRTALTVGREPGMVGQRGDRAPAGLTAKAGFGRSNRTIRAKSVEAGRWAQLVLPTV